MMNEKRDMTGVIFKSKPSDNPNRPQYDGNAMIDGQEFWISAWVKEGKTGKFFSLAFKPKDQKVVAVHSSPKRPVDSAYTNDIDSDIPF